MLETPDPVLEEMYSLIIKSHEETQAQMRQQSLERDASDWLTSKVAPRA